MRARHRLRLAANAANGSTLLGVAVARLGGARLHPAPGGLLVASGYRLAVPRAPAFCVGNVLVTRDAGFAGRPRLLAHEARHATQYAWCGLAMLPLYGIAAALSWALTGDTGAGNVFERGAGLAGGGYSGKGLRPALRRPARRRPARPAPGTCSPPASVRPGLFFGGA